MQIFRCIFFKNSNFRVFSKSYEEENAHFNNLMKQAVHPVQSHLEDMRQGCVAQTLATPDICVFFLQLPDINDEKKWVKMIYSWEWKHI